MEVELGLEARVTGAAHAILNFVEKAADLQAQVTYGHVRDINLISITEA
jgi:hypothetical protein